MEIFDVRHPLILVFGILGNIVSTGVYFAPMPTFMEIWKAKSTKGFESLPYVVSLFSALLWLYYALIKEGNTFLLITINTLGSLVEAIYVIIFIIYATSHVKKHTCKIVIGTMALWVVICVGSFMLLEGAKRAPVVGWLCVGVSICVFAAPLTILCEVVKTKSVQFMPFPLSCFLTLSAIMWFAYGMLTMDLCVTVPNIVGFVLGMIQMALYQYYKERSKVVSYKVSSEHTVTVVNIKLSNSEVYPMDSGGRPEPEEVLLEHNNDNNKGRDGDGDGVEVVEMKPPHVLVMCST